VTGAPQILTFEDGSSATMIRGASLQRVPDAAPANISLRLHAGSARFDVVKRPGRTFRVEAGTVTVEVVGTAFSVERAGAGARVSVARGRVKVSWADGQTYLQAAESGNFPPDDHAAPSTSIETMPAPAPATAPMPAAELPVGAAVPAVARASRPSWRTLARDGHYERAYKALGQAGPAAVKDEPGDLLTAADVARLSGHPVEAVPSLRRVLGRYRSDPRASLAAFTLGRVLLEETGDPRGAAEAFALLRTLDPKSPLYGDALAREAEAWARAGDRTRAGDRAAEYLRRFPTGAKADVLKRIIGAGASVGTGI
jgi:transmembrane sensor